LSRGLLDALIKFIHQASGPGWGLFGAVYEFQWPAALQAIKEVSDSGAFVRIIFDSIPGATGPRKRNAAAIAAAGIGGLCIGRDIGKIMHNKFFVLTRDDQPVAVWTGSTNLTENGIFGHSNCGHIIEDAEVARAYLNYWNELQKNVDTASAKSFIRKNNPAPPEPWTKGVTEIFSPRRGLDVLKWYAEVAGSAKQALFMTFAFGMGADFKQIYRQRDGILRFALMEKEGNGAALAQAKVDIMAIRSLPNVVVAVGNNIAVNSFDRWLKERSKLTREANVRWVHTKYMLVDPLGDNPVVITGSANFSAASTNSNDENMVVIKNDPRVADIYLGEFMRLYSHYAFRESVALARETGQDKTWQPNYLIPDDSWQKTYFWKNHQRSLRRRYFAGT
jgi:phosphatidylserine/phosphatidylglycerophosphate/cardiolipin synthase-like enzyme